MNAFSSGGVGNEACGRSADLVHQVRLEKLAWQALSMAAPGQMHRMKSSLGVGAPVVNRK